MAIYRCAGCGAVNRTPHSASSGAPSACYRCRRLLDTTGLPQRVDAAALVTTLRSSPAPVLVDFAGSDEPLPALDGLARARAGEILVLRVDPGAEPAAAQAFAVEGTRTVILFQDGSEVSRRPEPAAASDLRAWVEDAAPTA